MLRSWQDVVAKWQLLPVTTVDSAGDPASQCFQDALGALLDGRLDDAHRGFAVAAEQRTHPHDQLGMGDVQLARGGLKQAALHYRAALAQAPDDDLAVLAVSQLRVAAGQAAAAVDELEELLRRRPDDSVLRYYLASTLHAVTEQARSVTDEDRLVIANERQLDICERAARRILELGVPDQELLRGAELLLTEIEAGYRWMWRRPMLAEALTVLIVLTGISGAIGGGLSGSVVVVVLSVVLGGGLLFVVVQRFRRQVWRVRVDGVSIQRPGVS